MVSSCSFYDLRFILPKLIDQENYMIEYKMVIFTIQFNGNYFNSKFAWARV